MSGPLTYSFRSPEGYIVITTSSATSLPSFPMEVTITDDNDEIVGGPYIYESEDMAR